MAATDYFQRIDLRDGDGMLDRDGDNVREDFLNAIENIAPTQTVFMSLIGRGKSTDVYTSWLQDTLAEPNDTNAALDGDDIGADVSVKARRVGNINQISRKSVMVTGRSEVVDKAGRSSEMNYQVAKAAAALKRDMEAIMTGNQTAAMGATGGDADVLGGLRACFRKPFTGEVETAIVASDGANRLNTTVVPTAATDGTIEALSETNLRLSVERCYQNGGDPECMMLTPALKTVVSTYLYTSSARVAALYSDVGQKTSDGGASAQASVDVYISDFGALKIIPNRWQGYDITTTHAPRHRDLFVLDPSLWSKLYLRPYRTKNIAATGDAEKRLLLVDYSLQYKEEMGSGGVFDIDHETPMIP